MHLYSLLLNVLNAPSLCFIKQSKLEDRLEEAIHVLRSHAVGQGLEGAPDIHSLLSSVHNGALGGLSAAFPNASLALSNRHPAMVSHMLLFVCLERLGTTDSERQQDEANTSVYLSLRLI